MTSNHPETLDDALIRPGRIDRKIFFDNCDHKQIRNIFKMMFEKQINEEQLIKIEEYKYSPVEISSLLLMYKNRPDQALIHIKDIENKKIVYKKRLYSSSIFCDNSLEQPGFLSINPINNF